MISVVIHWEWTGNFSILTSSDWLYQGPETLKEFFSFPSIWSSITSFGDINFGISFTPFLILYSILSHWNVSYALSERIVFLWPILIAFPLCSYIFLKKNIGNSLAAIIGSFVYCYNTYFSVIKTGHLTLLVAYAFIPLVLLYFQKTLEKKQMRYAVLTGILGFIVSFYEFRAFYILCLVLFLYFLFYIFFVEKIRSLNSVSKIFFFAGMPIIIVILLNVYWLIPLARTGTLVTNPFFNRSLFGNEFLNISYAFTLFHPFWTGTKTAIFEVQPIPFYFWLIPLFAFLGLYFNRKSKIVLFFGIITLVGIFLTKQVGEPFSYIYPWLYNNFPGFNAFREASKFYLLIALGYSVLIAAFIDWLWNNWTKGKAKVNGKYFLTILIAGLFLWNMKPIITGEFETLFTPRRIPKDYIIIKNFILQQPVFSRTYWMPTYSRWNVYTNNHPQISAVNELNGSWNNLMRQEVKMDRYSYGELMLMFMQKPYVNTLLDLSSVRYVIIPIRDSANDDDFFVHYGETREYYIRKLDKLDYLQKINIGTKEVVVYENKEYRPHIYTTSSKETIYKKIPYQNVDYEFINPTQYKVTLKNISQPVYVNFSESYNPKWRLRIGAFNWYEVFTKQNYFLPESNHFQNDAKLNSFFIDPEKICKTYSCTINKNGTYDLQGTLFFESQGYLYIGMIISSAAFVTIILYFGYLWINFYIKKNDKKTI